MLRTYFIQTPTLQLLQNGVELQKGCQPLSRGGGGEQLRNTAVHMREWKNKDKGIFFSQECVKQGMRLGV